LALATVEVVPSESDGVAATPTENEFVGAEVTLATTATVSFVVDPEGREKLTVIVFVSPTLKPVVPLNEIAVGLRRVAFAGATQDISPNPNAETTTSARRLRFVFVDICFLSLVDSRTLLVSAR